MQRQYEPVRVGQYVVFEHWIGSTRLILGGWKVTREVEGSDPEEKMYEVKNESGDQSIDLGTTVLIKREDMLKVTDTLEDSFIDTEDGRKMIQVDENVVRI